MPTEDDRLRVLRSTRLLDSAPEEAFDRLTRVAAALMGSPIALVTLVDETRQFFKSALGLKEPWASRRESPLTYSLCKYATQERSRLVVNDTLEHPLLRDNKAIRQLAIRAYAGFPLIVSDAAIGALCVVDDRPRAWLEPELRVLQDLAGAAVSEIELRLALRETRRSAQVNRAIVERLPGSAVFVVDQEMRYVTADGPNVGMFLRRWKAEELIGRTATEIASDENREAILDVYASALRGEPRTFEMQRDGRTFEVSSVPIYDGDQVTHALVVIKDVTTTSSRRPPAS